MNFKKIAIDTGKLLLLGWVLILGSCSGNNEVNWAVYLGNHKSTHFVSATEITRDNVSTLEVAWTFDGGDADPENRSQIQCNPLIVDGVLYGSTASLKFVALDATNGQLIWTFNPFDGKFKNFGMGVNRGLIFWESPDKTERRLYFSAGPYLHCINADDGKPVMDFGQSGRVSLKTGLDKDVEDRFILSNTPGVIFEDKIIIGTRVDETSGAAPGHIRAFNIHTGERAWIFHTIPHPGEFGYDTWPENAWREIGGANAWTGMTVDKERGLVFVPTGSASYDFYGADRHGQNLFANCVLALNARTGERLWHFQTIHHDIWDRDLPAPPNLATITVNGEEKDVVIQITKMGFVYVLDRETGEPVFPVDEVPVPASDMPGELAWETQPVPAVMPPFIRQEYTKEEVTDISGESQEYVLEILSRTRYGHRFLPPTEQGGIVFPGFDGGGEWGGAAFNPETKTLFVNANEIPWIMTMVEVKEGAATNIEKGKGLYTQFCAGCHGVDRAGGDFMGKVPSLIGVKDRLDSEQFYTTITNGKGAMPAFAWLNGSQVNAIEAFLFELEEEKLAKAESKNDSKKLKTYTTTGYIRFKDQEGYPAIKPPWGTLSAIDIENARIKWRIPFGEHQELSNRGLPVTGTENYGGPAITSNGLLFIAASEDEKFRVFDQEDGSPLFEAELPAAGYATPSIYTVGGKQYVVIACGGGKLGTKSGDSYVAFSLPL
jgi:quinoprotein glucose dehydrogenase